MSEVIDLRHTDHFYPFRLLPGEIPRFWPRWEEMNRAYMVLATYDGTWDITPYPGTNSFTTNDTIAADYVWRGGCVYLFEDENGLLDAINAAGYNTVYSEIYVDTYQDVYFQGGCL